MTAVTTWVVERSVPSVAAVLCNADGSLFPSEEPAYEASTAVTNHFLAQLGVHHAYEPSELLDLTHGQSFRSAAAMLARLHGRHLDPEDLEQWVAVERDVVTAHLRVTLEPDAQVRAPLDELARRFEPGVVTSGASVRLSACLEVTGLADLFAPSRRISAESSMARPLSKPDPAVYSFACERLGVDPGATIAVEHSVRGAVSAVAAGCWTLGLLQFVPHERRRARADALRAVGVVDVVDSWWDVLSLLDRSRSRTAPPATARR
ncbi:MAG: HAD-superfamily hydrolase, subfamily variant 3 [Aeromicrobium sp.]|nr:HAD-superfamily hydrolase, subfamily variant 3 [Aeromicrobium sp.]